MIEKTFVDDYGTPVVRTTFLLPSSMWADVVHLVGDFNDWNQTSHPLERDRSGRWKLTIDLAVGRAYQFRYLRDGREWLNDDRADAYVYNAFGSDNFVVVTDPNFKRHM